MITSKQALDLLTGEGNDLPYSSGEAIDKLEADGAALVALRRIVKRALACGQFEKLEDARPYLGDGE